MQELWKLARETEVSGTEGFGQTIALALAKFGFFNARLVLLCRESVLNMYESKMVNWYEK